MFRSVVFLSISSLRNFQAFAFLVISLSWFIPIALAAPDADFDADGHSDLIVVRLLEEDVLRWRVVLSSSGFSQSDRPGDFGEPGDHLIPGQWEADGQESIGVLENRHGEVFWLILDSDGNSREHGFGKKNDHFISGADFNGNGIYDAARIRRNGKAVVHTDMFAQGSGRAEAVYELGFPGRAGRKGIPLFLNRGTGDELGVLLRKRSRKTGRVFHNLYLRQLGGDRETLRFGRLFRRGIDQVMPLQKPDGSDALVFVSDRKKVQVQVREVGGRRIDKGRFAGGSTVLVGDYLPDAGEEYAVVRGDLGRIINPFSGTSQSVALPNGVPADHVNIVSFREEKESGGEGGSEGGGATPGGGLESVCSSVQEVFAGILYKPEADVNDNRFGKPALLFTGSTKTGKSDTKIYASDGTQVCNFPFKASSEPGVNNGADHYFSGWIAGCDLTPSELASAARQVAGSSDIYIEWKGSTCLGPVNPTQRTGSI